MAFNLFAFSSEPEKQSSELIAQFAEWSAEIEAAAPIFDIEGELLEKLARDLPHHQFHYAKLAQEAKSLVKWLEIQKSKLESRHLKNYNNSPRALGVREQALYVQGERDVVEQNQLITEANLRANQFEEIVEALKQMGWMIGSIVKLRVAEIHEAIIWPPEVQTSSNIMSNASYQGYNNTLAGYGQSAYQNSMLQTNSLDLLLEQYAKHPFMVMGIVNGDIEMRFFGEDEYGNAVQAIFAPEYDLTAHEYMRINQLSLMIVVATTANNSASLRSINSIEYLRKHNLERHFKFKPA